jgi:hypothetical protein
MKNIFKVLIAACLLAPLTVKADFDVGWVVGTAKTLVDAIHGDTTITPQIELWTWDSYVEAIVSNPSAPTSASTRQTVRRDPIAGTLFYQTRNKNFPPLSDVTDNTPFNLGGSGGTQAYVYLNNYSCTAPYWFNIQAQSYSLALKVTVSSTGIIALPPPYEISFKTMGTKLPDNCYDPGPFGTRRFGKSVSVGGTGTTKVVVGNPNYQLDWPISCWAGAPYQQ